MDSYYSIAFGAALGALLSFFATELSARRRSAEDREKNNKALRDEIITDCLKYIFKANDVINEIRTNKDTISTVRAIDPDKVGQIQKQLYGTIDSKLKEGIFIELMHVTTQIRRIGDNEFVIQFDGLVEFQRRIMDALLFKPIEVNFEQLDKEYSDKFQKFVEYSINIFRI